MQKRVLIFSLAYFPDLIGGAEIAVKEITDRMNTVDYQFDMITWRSNNQLSKVEKMGNITVYRIGFGKNKPDLSELSTFPLVLNKYLFPFLSVIKAIQLNFINKYDIIWSVMANYAGFGAMFFKTIFPKCYFVLNLQEGDPIEHIKQRVKRVYPLFVQIFKKANHIVTVSNFLADFAKTMNGCKNIQVVPNGVDRNVFAGELDTLLLQNVKNKLQKGKNDVFIVTSSRLVKKNGIADVILSLHHLPENYKFLILGDGPDREQLKLFTEAQDLTKRVYFLGHILHDMLPYYLKVSDVFIRPSLSEGFGLAFLEAMAAGIPVIGTAVGGTPDCIFDPFLNPENKPTGLFCKVQDPIDIAEKIALLINDEHLKIEIIQNAKKMVEEKYDWMIVAKHMQRVFESSSC
jgi:glycosyltransferase involved in cell wall biosynthesis